MPAGSGSGTLTRDAFICPNFFRPGPGPPITRQRGAVRPAERARVLEGAPQIRGADRATAGARAVCRSVEDRATSEADRRWCASTVGEFCDSGASARRPRGSRRLSASRSFERSRRSVPPAGGSATEEGWRSVPAGA